MTAGAARGLPSLPRLPAARGRRCGGGEWVGQFPDLPADCACGHWRWAVPTGRPARARRRGMLFGPTAARPPATRAGDAALCRLLAGGGDVLATIATSWLGGGAQAGTEYGGWRGAARPAGAAARAFGPHVHQTGVCLLACTSARACVRTPGRKRSNPSARRPRSPRDRQARDLWHPVRHHLIRPGGAAPGQGRQRPGAGPPSPQV